MNKLRLVVTDYCPKNCAGCCMKNLPQQPMDITYADALLHPAKEVYITGGEPMCMKASFLLPLIRQLKDAGKKVFLYSAYGDTRRIIGGSVNTTTEGSRPSAHGSASRRVDQAEADSARSSARTSPIEAHAWSAAPKTYSSCFTLTVAPSGWSAASVPRPPLTNGDEADPSVSADRSTSL